jgi:hypothetical protein
MKELPHAISVRWANSQVLMVSQLAQLAWLEPMQT